MSVSRRSVLASLAALVALPAAMAEAAGKTIRVRFKPGSSAAVMSGKVKGYDYDTYLVEARAGQTMSVILSTTLPTLNFVVIDQASGENLALETPDTWSGPLPATGRYEVRVVLMRSDARRGKRANYQLTIGIA